ncbi:MAG: preprotein translocase subunit YajC [Ezakiella sp.]|nr:preprotein translocase subunit YajC [Ezakiella sp.]MDD7471937.1 preprotein translocase subunit YajC [Bacillota bacterium]MDY3923901.1 preprotein translocase subunit YajC [Ezakiella sp.]
MNSATAAQGSPFLSLLPMLVVLLFFYLFVIKPQKKRDKEIQAMRSELKPGDEIITIAGTLGKIVQVKDDIVVIEVGSQKNQIDILKSSVATISKKKDVKDAKVDTL